MIGKISLTLKTERGSPLNQSMGGVVEGGNHQKDIRTQIIFNPIFRKKNIVIEIYSYLIQYLDIQLFQFLKFQNLLLWI